MVQANTKFDDGFGYSIALSTDGTTLAVGATGEGSLATGIDGDQADNSAPGAGAVYLFTRSSTGWSQQAYVKPSNTGDSAGISPSVALSAAIFERGTASSSVSRKEVHGKKTVSGTVV
jgi:hypothetical protein